MQVRRPAWCRQADMWGVMQAHVEDSSAELDVSVWQECGGLALNAAGHFSHSLQALAVIYRARGTCPGLHLAVWAGDWCGTGVQCDWRASNGHTQRHLRQQEVQQGMMCSNWDRTGTRLVGAAAQHAMAVIFGRSDAGWHDSGLHTT